MVLTSEVRKVTKMCGALIARFEILPLKKKSQIKPFWQLLNSSTSRSQVAFKVLSIKA